jgi:antitoxin VapB
MPPNIKDPNTEKVVHELASIKVEAVTTAVKRATEARHQRDMSGRRLADELLAMGARCSALPDLATRSADDIPAYDEHGLPN